MQPVKVIYYHPKTPAYELYTDAPRPPVHWDTPDGSWVGIWGYDWADLLGNSVLAYAPGYAFEVWQPDVRADRVYEHRFENGLVHKLFPATVRKNGRGKSVVAASVPEALERERRTHQVVLQTGVSPHLNWLVQPAARQVRVMGTYHGTIQLPQQQLFKLRKKLSRYAHLVKEHFAFKEVLSNFHLITYQNDTNLSGFKKLFKGPMHKITMGVDFDQFQVRNKTKSRQLLGLPTQTKVLLTVGRLNPLKQNDKVIAALNKCSELDFLLLVVGTPNEAFYMDYLKELAAPLLRQGKIQFPGYRKGAELINYYNAADLFIMSSTSEGCSVASMEAIACGTPVFSTDTGYIAELLQEKGKGYVTGIRDYRQWETALRGFLTGELPVCAYPRDTAYEEFSWPAVAGKFKAAYQQLIADGR